MKQLITQDEHERLRGDRHILWQGGPPPEDDVYHSHLMEFLQTLEKTGSWRVARKESGLLSTEIDRFLGQSPWFCQQVNGLINEARREIAWSSINRAIGYVKSEADGTAQVDHHGKVIYHGASDKMAMLHLVEGGIASIPESGKAVPGDLLRVRLNQRLSVVPPFITRFPEKVVYEVGAMDPATLARAAEFTGAHPAGVQWVEVFNDGQRTFRAADWSAIAGSLADETGEDDE